MQDTKSSSSATCINTHKNLPQGVWSCSVPGYLIHIYPYLKWALTLPVTTWGYDELTNCWTLYVKVSPADKVVWPGMLGDVDELWLAFPSKEV